MLEFLNRMLNLSLYLENARKFPLLDPKVDMATESGMIQARIPRSLRPYV